MLMFTEENCKMVIDLMDNDEQKGMEMMMDLLISYQTKYMNILVLLVINK